MLNVDEATSETHWKYIERLLTELTGRGFDPELACAIATVLDIDLPQNADVDHLASMHAKRIEAINLRLRRILHARFWPHQLGPFLRDMLPQLLAGEPVQPDHQPIATAPENERVLIFGHMPEGQEEMALAWLDLGDKQWYFAPQGGLVPFTPITWCRVPRPAAD